ncbi:hypothetical protein CU663_05730 [Pseudomonas syringae pv. actinidifoliorum]|nr:hypothetical protein [Pseudomonas syringae pv. actinidifoliorum]
MAHKLPGSISMWPAATDDPDTIYYWINSVVNDDVMSLILQSKAFKRLYDISFLGALDYTHPGTEIISKKNRSRAEHSLHVAALAAYVSAKRNYTPELKRHLIIAALLHDVGHAPLSHSAEPLIKKENRIWAPRSRRADNRWQATAWQRT